MSSVHLGFPHSLPWEPLPSPLAFAPASIHTVCPTGDLQTKPSAAQAVEKPLATTESHAWSLQGQYGQSLSEDGPCPQEARVSRGVAMCCVQVKGSIGLPCGLTSHRALVGRGLRKHSRQFIQFCKVPWVSPHAQRLCRKSSQGERGIGWLGSLGSSSMGNLYSLATVSESTVFDPQQRKWGGPDGLLSLYFQHVAENRTSQGLDVSRRSKEEAREEAHSESEQQRCGTWVG